METVILIFHLIIVVTMVLVILLQRNSNDGLSGLGGGSSNPGAMMSARGSSNPLSKATSILAALFIMTSLTLAYLANAKNESVIIDEVPEIKKSSQVPFELDEKEVNKALDDGVAANASKAKETSKDADVGDAAPVGSVVPEAKKVDAVSDSVKKAAEEKAGEKAPAAAKDVPLAQ